MTSDEHLAQPPLVRILFLPFVILAISMTAVGFLSTQALLAVIIDGLSALVIVVPPMLAGLWLVPAFRIPNLPLRWHLILGAALGLGVTSLLVLCLGLAGFLHRPLWLAILIAQATCGIVRLRQLLGAGVAIMASDTIKTSPTRLSWLWLLTAPLLTLSLIAASNAPGILWEEEGFGYDVLEYHLQVPKEAFTAGSIEYLPHNVYANFPSNVEMLYLLAMVVHDSDVELGPTYHFIHLIFALLAVGAAWAAGRDRSREAGILAGVATASVGWLPYLSGVAFVENAMLFYGLCALGLVCRNRSISEDSTANKDGGDIRQFPQLQRGTIVLSGVLAGFACGCKYTAIPMIALPMGFGLLILPALGMNIRDRVVRSGVFLTATFLALSPWLVKNTIATGNPVFPLASSVFDASPAGWGVAQQEQWDVGHAPAAKDAGLSNKLKVLWKHIPGDSLQRFGPFILLLPLLGLMYRPRDSYDGMLLVALVIQLAIWLMVTHLYARFAVVMLIPLVLLVAKGLGHHASVLRRCAIFGSLTFGTIWNAYHVTNLVWAELAHPKLVAGISIEAFTQGGLPGYEYIGFVNDELPADAKVLLLGESRAYYFKKEVDYTVVFNRSPFVEAIRRAENDLAIADWLHENGYTHILVHWGEIRRLARSTYGFPAQINHALFEKLAHYGVKPVRKFSHPQSMLPYVAIYEVTSLPEI